MKHNVNQPNAEIKTKKKHHLLWLWITLGIVFVLVIAPVTLTYGLFYDSYTENLNIDENSDIKELTQRALVDSLDKSKTEKKINFQFTQDDLNQLLYMASKDVIKKTNGMIEQFYVKILDNNYTFSLKAKVPLFQTKIDLICKLEDFVNNTNHNEDALKFSIADIRVGRLGGMKNIATSLLSNFISEGTLQQMFADVGLHMEVSLKESYIIYKHSQLLTDVQAIAGSSEEIGIFYDVMKDFMNKGLVNFSFFEDKAFKATAPLDKVATNAKYCTDDKKLNIPLDKYRNDLVKLLNSNIVDTAHSVDVFNYFLRGYNHVSDSIKTYLTGKDFSSIGINDISVYEGYPLYSDSSINKILEDQINLTDIATGKIGKITEDDINANIKSTEVIGYTYLLQRKDGDNYKVNYLSVDNFYVNIVDSSLYMVVGLNVNGFETNVIFTANQKDTANYALNFEMGKSYYGDIECGNNLETLFFDVIDEATNNEDWISVDKTNKTMKIDFSSVINANPYKTQIDTYGNVNIACVGTDLSSQGYLNIDIVSQ